MKPETTYALVRPATSGERLDALDLLTAGFADDPLARWLFPDPVSRPELQARFHRRTLAAPAEVDVLTDGGAVAVWHRHGPDDPAPDDADGPPVAVFGESAARLVAIGRALAVHRPVGVAHLSLPCMVVAPARQGAGLGSAMLRHGLDRADAEWLGVRLEASTPRSRALYQRFGFADAGPAVRTADSPPLWPMWRPPAGAPAQHQDGGRR